MYTVFVHDVLSEPIKFYVIAAAHRNPSHLLQEYLLMCGIKCKKWSSSYHPIKMGFVTSGLFAGIEVAFLVLLSGINVEAGFGDLLWR